jgi:hypothetical protein
MPKQERQGVKESVIKMSINNDQQQQQLVTAPIDWTQYKCGQVDKIFVEF